MTAISETERAESKDVCSRSCIRIAASSAVEDYE